MKQVIVLIAGFILFAAATSVTTNTIVEPASPKEVKVLHGALTAGKDVPNLEITLTTLKNFGWIVKTCSYNDKGSYLVILEKYNHDK